MTTAQIENDYKDVTVYLDETAHKVCNLILDNEDYSDPIEGFESCSVGFWKEKGKWVAYDNATGNCWVEEFTDYDEMTNWLFMETDD